MDFAIETFQNEYLPTSGTDVHAIATVRARGAEPASGDGPTAVVLVIDTSGSMQGRRKLASAKQAATAAIGQIVNGALFAVIAGTDVARVVYPPRGVGLVPATAATRAEASAFIGGLNAHGGTAIGRWLMAAHDCLRSQPSSIRHAILLTDGKDESETREYFEAAVARCEGAFQCDCRGVGTDWVVDELRFVAARLLGTVDILAETGGLAADFTSMMHGAMARRAADVGLRVWTPRGAEVRFVKQVSPTIIDLTDRAVRLDERTLVFPTGAWGWEDRDYHVAIAVPPQPVGTDMLAGRLGLVVGGEVIAKSLVKAVWTDDATMSARIEPHVAHFTGQAELADAITAGLVARDVGNTAAAEEHLGRATRLATATGNTGTLELLSRVVHVDDARAGTVRLKGGVPIADTMTLDTRSTRTVRLDGTSVV